MTDDDDLWCSHQRNVWRAIDKRDRSCLICMNPFVEGDDVFGVGAYGRAHWDCGVKISAERLADLVLETSQEFLDD